MTQDDRSDDLAIAVDTLLRVSNEVDMRVLFLDCPEISSDDALALLRDRDAPLSSGIDVGRQSNISAISDLITDIRTIGIHDALIRYCFNLLIIQPEKQLVELAIAYPEILSDAIYRSLGQLYRHAQESQGEDISAKINEKLTALTEVRLALLGPDADLGISFMERDSSQPDPNSVLQEINRLAAHENPTYRCALIRYMLDSCDFSQQPELEGYLKRELAITLFVSPVGRRDANIEQSMIALLSAEMAYGSSESESESWAAVRVNLGATYLQRALGDKLQNRKRAIEALNSASEIYARESHPADWATIIFNLAAAHKMDLSSEAQERAIAGFSAALEIFTPVETPHEYASANASLVSVYLGRVDGSEEDNIELAIQHGIAANTVYMRQHAPIEWYQVQHQLAVAYLRRRLGDRSANIDEALKMLSEAGDLITYTAYPVEYADLESSLGATYAQRVSGHQDDNLEQALLHYQNSLRARISFKSTEGQADLQLRIAEVYTRLTRGDRKQNLETAIAYLDRALISGRGEADQRTKLLAHFQLGIVYQERLEGDTRDNLEQALIHFEAAATEPAENSPKNHAAMTWANLGTLYCKRIVGSTASNIDHAIDAYKIALENVDQQFDPAMGSKVSFDLGNTYRQRENGTREENLNFAIEYFRAALTDYALQNMPEQWAAAQQCLAECYAIQNDPNALSAAIQASEAALAVFVRGTASRERTDTQSLLGTLLARRLAIHYREADQERAIAALYAAAQAFKAALMDLEPTSNPLEWASINRELADLYTYISLDKENTFFDQRVTALNEALRAIDRHQEPKLWADVQVELAQVYGNQMSARSTDQRTKGFEIAVKYYQMALTVYTVKADPIRFAEISYSLATLYLNKRDTERVITICREALMAIAKGEAPGLGAAIQSRLGDAYTLRTDGNISDNLESALANYRQALKYPNLDLRQKVSISVDLAMAFRQRMDAPHSENLEESLKILIAASGEISREADPRIWSRVWTMLGIIYRERVAGDRRGNIERAIEAFLHALTVRSRKTDAVEWAETQVNLAGAYWDRLYGQRADDLEQARECLLDVVDVFSWENNIEIRIDVLTNLAVVTRERLRGDRVQNAEQAIAYLEEAVIHASGSRFRHRRARIQQQLGVAYVERIRGDNAENLEIAIKALRAASRGFNRQSDPVEWANVRAELGIAYVDRVAGDRTSNTRNAIRAFKDAATIFELHGLPLDWAWMQHELGIAYKTAEAPGNANLGRSIAAFEAALGVRSIAATPHDWASSQLGLGNSYMILQEDRQTTLDLAARCYKAAAEVLENYGSPHDRRRAWEALGNACRDLERWDDAVSAYVCAVEAADELYEASILPSDQELELARFTDLYASTAYAMTRLEDFDLREAVVVVERGRAKRLGEVLSRTNVLGLPELDARDREALQAAVDDLHALEVAERRPGALTASIGRGFGSADSRLEADPAGQRLARAVVHAQVEAARLKVRSHINDLAERFGVPSPTKRIEWREIVGAVKEGEPIAYLLAYGNETVVLITERQLDDVNVRLMRIVGFGEKELSDILTERGDGHVATGLLFGQLTNDVQMIRDSLPAVLSVLGGKLLSKLDLELRSTGARAVIIIPTNFLISIPFHAAPYEIDGRLTRFFEEFRVSYAPSMRALSMARQRVENRERPTLAGIGNPSNDLIYAEAELRHISSLFPAGATHLLYRSDATAARTLEMLTGAKYVHLSCHGVFNPEFPLNSYLKLAEQDRITLQDLLATQNLQGVRLVTVSACSTAVVDIQRLADEVIGMPSAFIQAGAAGVLGTLWPVGDLPTALIMCRFYELHLLADDPSEREGLEPADALRSAQCWLANANAQELTAYCNERNSLRDALNQTIRGRALARMAGSARPFGNPYYWAPFIFVGA